ncbi:hypothetical protein [Nioella sp.]|uniref:hypothetical protein n=1 Tax=Nioella sp. TaxID=1912091 RepID=UPI003A8A89AE
MPVDLIKASLEIDAVRLRAPWLTGFAFHCVKGRSRLRVIRAGDIAWVHVMTGPQLDACPDLAKLVRDVPAPGDGVSFLSGPHVAGRDAHELAYLITLSDGEWFAVRISTSPGSMEDVGAKMFRTHVTAQQHRAATG